MTREKIRQHLESLHRRPWLVTHYAGGLRFDGPPSVYQAGSDNGYGEPVKIAECFDDNEAEFIAHAPEYIEFLLHQLEVFLKGIS